MTMSDISAVIVSRQLTILYNTVRMFNYLGGVENSTLVAVIFKFNVETQRRRLLASAAAPCQPFLLISPVGVQEKSTDHSESLHVADIGALHNSTHP